MSDIHKEIIVSDTMQSEIDRIKGTAYTTCIADELISAWMKVRNSIEANNGEQCFAAALFIKKIFDWYIISISSRIAVEERIDYQDNINYDDHIHCDLQQAMNDILCFSMGLVLENTHGQYNYIKCCATSILQVIERMIRSQHFRDNIDAIIQTKSKIPAWRNPSSWKDIRYCDYDYRLDYNNSDDIDLCFFFENMPYIERHCDNGHDGIDMVSVDKIIAVFTTLKKFFKPPQREECNISENWLVDLWFQYKYPEMLEHRCYYGNNDY